MSSPSFSVASPDLRLLGVCVFVCVDPTAISTDNCSITSTVQTEKEEGKRRGKIVTTRTPIPSIQNWLDVRVMQDDPALEY